MSDTANPPSLASIDDFDARLKRTDEDRWLATRYAPKDGRERLVALYLLNQELQRTLHTSEAMLGKIRLQWWRETVDQIAGTGPVRRHDLAEELSRIARMRPDLIAPMNALIDRFDDILDDHLHAGGHQPGGDHEARHLAVEGVMMKLAGLALDPAASAQHLAALAAVGEARIAVAADLVDAASRWTTAAKAARQVPSILWPALLHLSLPGEGATPFQRRWRMFRASLSRKL